MLSILGLIAFIALAMVALIAGLRALLRPKE